MSTLFHAGIVVFDLERAMRDFSEALEVDFEKPRTLSLDGRLAVNDLTADRQLRISYSVVGDMRIELIAAQEDGVWGAQNGEGFHHIGAWETDTRGAIVRHAAFGREPEMTVISGSNPTVYFPPATLHGVRLELITHTPEILPIPADAGTPFPRATR